VELDAAKAFMQNHYYFISEETNEGYANQFTLANFSVDNIFDYAKKMVMKYGINILVIDPWNTLDHQYGVGQDKLDYISKALDKFRNFAKKYNVFTKLIAHPTKMQKELVKVKDSDTGQIKEKWKFRVPDLSNVADSNHFHNKPAIGMTFYRDYDLKISTFIVNKMKHKHIGHHGSVDFVYDWISGRFTVDGSKVDGTNWLVSGVPEMGYNEPSSVFAIPSESPVIVAENNETKDLPF
jgi:twinkle protein